MNAEDKKEPTEANAAPAPAVKATAPKAETKTEKAPAKTAKKKFSKLTSAKKRDLQNEKRRLANRQNLSKIKTGLKDLSQTIEKKDAVLSKQKLSSIYSLLDKGAKSKLIKKNKANRLKSKLTMLLQSKA
ncbi:MAG: 30S ribosomal protein S20 [Parachlamydiales bacterium]|jgi:small subunit ribosomal protein S20